MPQALIDALMDFFPKGLVVMDLETTGLSPLTDKIIEIGAVKILPEGTQTTLATLVNPQIDIPPVTTAVHHITNEMVQKSPPIEAVSEDFKQFIGDLPLVAHNAQFDMGFIFQEILKGTEFGMKNDVVCTVRLSRSLMPKAPSHKLSNLIKHFQIHLENTHRALDDAQACLWVLANLCHMALSDENWQHNRPGLYQKSMIFSLQDFGRVEIFDLPIQFQPLLQLIKDQTIFEFEYNSGSKNSQQSKGNSEGRYRPIRPIGLLPFPKGIMLHGLCLLSGTHKSFYLKKIGTFRQPPEKNMQKYLKKIAGFNAQRNLLQAPAAEVDIEHNELIDLNELNDESHSS
jgi:DNA polymerase III epsilon subunit family exonuclease